MRPSTLAIETNLGTISFERRSSTPFSSPVVPDNGIILFFFIRFSPPLPHEHFKVLTPASRSLRVLASRRCQPSQLEGNFTQAAKPPASSRFAPTSRFAPQ